MNNSLLPNEYNISDAMPRKMDGFPREAILDTVPRSALGATKKIVNLIPITGNSNIRPSGQVQFLIPQRALAKAHSFYLNFRYTSSAAECPQNWSFAGCSQSAGSLINNITIQAGGAIIESLQNYHLWHNNIMPWTYDGRALTGIESIASGSQLPDTTLGKFVTSGGTEYNQDQSGFVNGGAANRGAGTFITRNVWAHQFDGGAAINTTFSIPIYCGFFNPKEGQFVPLQFINGGVLVTIQFNNLLKAFCSDSAGASPTNFALSDFELCYTEITPSTDYIMKIRSELAAEDKRIRIECQSYQQYLTQCTNSLRQMFNANLTSLAAIFWGRVAEDAAASTKCFFGNNFDGDQGVRYEVYLDNVLLYQSTNQLNQMSAQIRQVQEAIQASISDYTSVPLTVGRGNSASATGMGTMFQQNMLYGLSTKLFSSNSVSMDGVPVNTLTMQFTTTGETSSNTWYIYLVYDYIYTVDASGSVQKYA
jgi:hypothetical protein